MQDIRHLRIVLIGAGNLATNLGMALTAIGCNIVQVYSRTKASAQTLADRIKDSDTDRICDFTDEISNIRTDADVYIVSIKDSALAELSDEITAINPEALWVHTAGSMPMDIFSTLRRGVFYPMQTFSKSELVTFKDIPVFIEASNEEDSALLHSIANAMSKKVYELDSSQRKHLHLAAVFCCNFVNHCCTMSADVLSNIGVPFDVMLPLIDRTAEKLHTMSPVEAQTGPAVRYDSNVMEAQMGLLSTRPDLQQIYRAMSDSIHRYALKHDAD